MDKQLKIMVIGAHPDDSEIAFGGASMFYSILGHKVLMVSMTNGDIGHHSIDKETLASIRKKEAYRGAKIMGVKYKIMPFHDGELEPTLYYRKKLLTVIREFSPDAIFTHSPMEYHPDHRYTNQLVIDTSYMVMVPNADPKSPPMKHNPYYFYFSSAPVDGIFNLCIPIDLIWEKKLSVLDQHKSQMYEWLPWIGGFLDKVPSDDTEKIKFLDKWRSKKDISIANNYREWLKEKYGKNADKIRCIEAIVSAPIGRQIVSQEEIPTLFPFL